MHKPGKTSRQAALARRPSPLPPTPTHAYPLKIGTADVVLGHLQPGGGGDRGTRRRVGGRVGACVAACACTCTSTGTRGRRGAQEGALWPYWSCKAAAAGTRVIATRNGIADAQGNPLGARRSAAAALQHTCNTRTAPRGEDYCCMHPATRHATPGPLRPCAKRCTAAVHYSAGKVPQACVPQWSGPG